MQLYNYTISNLLPLKLLDSSNHIFLSKKNIIKSYGCQKIYKFDNNQNREISLCLNTNSFIFRVKDVVSFQCFTKTNKIFYQFHKEGNQKLLDYWLAHTLLPIFFTITNKYYFLHAGAVKIENKTILFMADSMGGKSTITNYFIQKGHTLVSDDKVGTFEEEGNFKLVSSYPYHRPYRKFEDLGLKVENFEEAVTNLDIIYMLDVDEEYDEVKLTELKGVEKLSLLIRGTEIGLPFLLKERFAYITKLANSTPVFQIQIPKDLKRLSEVYSKIIQHTKEVKRDEFRE